MWSRRAGTRRTVREETSQIGPFPTLDPLGNHIDRPLQRPDGCELLLLRRQAVIRLTGGIVAQLPRSVSHAGGAKPVRNPARRHRHAISAADTAVFNSQRMRYSSNIGFLPLGLRRVSKGERQMSHRQGGTAAIGFLHRLSACITNPSHDVQPQRPGARAGGLTNRLATQVAPAVASACQRSSRAR
jgi:hypothetical protein